MKTDKRKAQLKALTKEEQDIFLPKLIKLLLRTNKNKTLMATDIVKIINEQKGNWGDNLPAFQQSRLRKLINHIRINELLPIISGYTGYYVSYKKIDILEFVVSQEQRAESIIAAAEGMKKICQTIENEEKEGWGFKFKERNEDIKDDIWHEVEEQQRNFYKD
jgi:hypothetical protein